MKKKKKKDGKMSMIVTPNQKLIRGRLMGG
jgi:hypothetical protein